jgi:hypothetical protein
MNQIVKLKGFSSVVTGDFGFTGSKADFKVGPRRLQIVGDNAASAPLPVVSDKAIVRMVDSRPVQLGIVGADYKIVQHVDFFGPIEDALKASIRPDLARDPQVRTLTSYHGAFVKREYVFPAFADALAGSETLKAKFGYRVVAWNSLDGSSTAGLLSGLIDFYCTNGVIAGSLIGKKLRRHTSGFDIAAFEEQIAEGLTIAQNEVRWLETLAATKLDFAKAEKFLKAEFSERLADNLMAQVQREVPVRGRNLFALLSALTFYASHADGAAANSGFGVRATGSDHAAKTLHSREVDVQKAIRSDGFRALLAA